MLALAALLLSAWPALTHPQNELLLVDLDASPSPAFALDSFPLVNGESAQGVLFSAEQSEIGREPWWTDGTPQGTWTAGDLRPGPAGSDAGPALRLPDGRFLLPLWSDGYGVEPHVLDPAQRSVALLDDLHPGPNSSSPGQALLWRGDAYFFASAPETGRELYRLNLGSETLELVHEFEAGATGVSVGSLEATDGSLFANVRRQVGLFYEQLWALDESQGTWTRVIHLDVSTGEYVDLLGSVGDSAVFSLNRVGEFIRPWSSDGTLQGTVPLAAPPAAVAFTISALAGDDQRLWLRWPRSDADDDLVLTDGTPAGTSVVESNSGPVVVSPWPGGALLDDGRLVFAAADSSSSSALWVSDGTPATTAPILDATQGPTLEGLEQFLTHAGEVLTIGQGPQGFGIYRTDGSAQGTGPRFVPPAALGVSGLELLAPLSGGLLLSLTEPQYGAEPWFLADNEGAPQLVQDLNVEADTRSSSPGDWVRLRDTLQFSAERATTGRELFRTTGTAAGTKLLFDLDPGPVGSMALPRIATENYLLYTARVGNEGLRLWRVGSNAALNEPLTPPEPGAVEFGSDWVQWSGGQWFSKREADGTGSIWRTLGSPGSTEARVVPAPGTGGVIEELAALPDVLVFTFRGDPASSGGHELWTTDGTQAGTLLLDLWPGPLGSDPAGLQQALGRLWFAASTPDTGRELWSLDASGAPQLLADLTAGNTSPTQLIDLGERLFFVATAAESVRGAWSTDGTAAGTVPLVDSTLAPPTLQVHASARAGERAFFLATGADGVLRLFCTDGTPAGTHVVADALPTGEPLIPSWLHPVGSAARVLFAAQADGTGVEPWSAGEQPGDLAPVADIAAGPLSSFPARPERFASTLVFGAFDALHGREPRALDVTDAGGWLAEPFGPSCGGARVSSSGAARLGETLEVHLDALPSSLALLYFGLAPQVQQLGPGCQLLIGGPKLLAATATDGAGLAAVQVVLPDDPVFIGLDVVLQWFCAESGGPFQGIGQLSDRLEVSIGS